MNDTHRRNVWCGYVTDGKAHFFAPYRQLEAFTPSGERIPPSEILDDINEQIRTLQTK